MSDRELSTRYEPGEIEPRIAAQWLESGIFSPDATGSADENYSIAIPPPNVTGALHMGHALNGSIQDVLIRRARMAGKHTKWILGTDHAGIATQMKVEQELAEQGTSRQELGREEFVKRVWDWRERYGAQIIEQYKRLGASCDFDDENFTLDPGYAEAVAEVFVKLYNKGYIYRDNYMVNWDPGSRSAISDLEVVEREVTDALYEIAYPLADGSGEIVVATVRPETILADTGIAVNPEDDRYKHLVGKEAVLPLVGRKLPIVADDYVKIDFGTGALKITPGHDPNDFELGRRHGFEEISVIGEDGRLTEVAGGEFVGLTAEQAKDAVVAALQADGALRKQEPYTHTVPFSERSGERIEPLISLQWFMRMDELAAPAIAAVEQGDVKFHPDRWKKVYLDWLNNIRPWCLSRQLWWGHRLPVWYRESDASEATEIYVGTEAPKGDGWRRDEDVLDTWFSSALWPFATLGWPQQTDALEAFYPTNVLSTAREILFLWVARMVMMGREFTGKDPFGDVYIHSVIQARDGRRMSKSLGTGIDPIGEFEQHGADAVRFGLLAMASSQDVRYSDEKVQQGHQLANKLWNASRLILSSSDEALPLPEVARVEDRWILSRLERAKQQSNERIDQFDFSQLSLGLYDFVFSDLCDWYLELIKPRLYSDDPEVKLELAGVVQHVLRETLALAHPVIPFVTEALWAAMPGTDGLLASATWPTVQSERFDAKAEAQIAAVIEAITSLRGWREQINLAPSKRVSARLVGDGYTESSELIANLGRIDWVDEVPNLAATLSIPGGSLEISADGAIDLEAAQRRVDDRRKELESEIKRAEGKLANESFTVKAPAELVQKERDKLQQFRAELAELG